MHALSAIFFFKSPSAAALNTYASHRRRTRARRRDVVSPSIASIIIYRSIESAFADASRATDRPIIVNCDNPRHLSSWSSRSRSRDSERTDGRTHLDDGSRLLSGVPFLTLVLDLSLGIFRNRVLHDERTICDARDPPRGRSGPRGRRGGARWKRRRARVARARTQWIITLKMNEGVSVMRVMRWNARRETPRARARALTRGRRTGRRRWSFALAFACAR